MLTRRPRRGRGDGDTRESVFFNFDSGFLAETIFEEGAEPGINVARDVDCCCSDEVVP